MKKILVTGFDGFIGSHLVGAFSKKGYNLVLPPSQKKGFDIRSKRAVLGLPRADVVVHLAAVVNVPYSWDHPRKTIEVNLLGTLNILDYCRVKGSSLIYPGTYAYGIPKYLPLDEDHPILTNNPYAVSKIAAENLCQVYHERFNFPVTVIRMFNPYGPGQAEKMVISQMMSEVISQKTITIFSGKPKRDFVYIDDVTSAFVLAVAKVKTGYHVYNLGFGKSWSIAEVAKKLSNISGQKVKIVDKKQERPNEIMNTVASIEKIGCELGWKPMVNLDEGLRKNL